MSHTVTMPADLLSILSAAPACYLVLLPDAPRFTIVAATDAYLKATYTTREGIIGKGLFEVFPDNPALPHASGVQNLVASLCQVLAHKQEHRMAQQRYDIMHSQKGDFASKVWRPLNKPVLNKEGDVQYIIHWVEDITGSMEVQELKESKWFIEQVLEATPDFISVFDLQQGRVEFISHSAYNGDVARYHETLNIDYQQILERAHPADRDSLYAYMEGFRMAADDELRTFDYRVVREGQVLWYRSRGKVFRRNEAGETTHYISILQDITQLKQTEAELLEEHYFLEQVTDKSPHLIYVFDMDEQRFTYINRRVNELIGHTEEYVYAMGPHLFQAVLHPEDLPLRAAYMLGLASLNDQEIRHNDFRIWTGKAFRWFRSKDSIFKREGGRVKQVIGLAEDVTYERLLQEKAQHENAQIGLN